jgi:hypothetical protein
MKKDYPWGSDHPHGGTSSNYSISPQGFDGKQIEKEYPFAFDL